jgi:CHAD domain-containing protein
MLEALLRQNPNWNVAGRDWLRALKQVRRAAGPVRDLDVHGKLLQRWLGEDSSLPGMKTDAALTRQSEKLGDWLKDERRRLARRMARQIEKRQPTLSEAEDAFLAAMASGTRRTRASFSPESVALEDFVRAVDNMPALHAENLHDFRKATKKARYVAESGADGEKNSSVAKALKRVQDSIGDWHDWHCLQHEARVALGGDAPDLHAFLEIEVEKHFALAMKTTHVVRARLIGEWMAMQPTKRKRPSGSVRLAKNTGSMEVSQSA